jgi:hypothetical protein
VISPTRYPPGQGYGGSGIRGTKSTGGVSNASQSCILSKYWGDIRSYDPASYLPNRFSHQHLAGSQMSVPGGRVIVVLKRLRERQEWQFFAVLPKADRRLCRTVVGSGHPQRRYARNLCSRDWPDNQCC